MQTLKQLALGFCLLCMTAGVIHIFWPENRFKPVINTVLMLYILTSVFRMAGGVNWPAITNAVREWERPETEIQYQNYAQELGEESAVQALQSLLASNGIPGKVRSENGNFVIVLQNQTDEAAAEELLQKNCAPGSYSISWGGGDE